MSGEVAATARQDDGALWQSFNHRLVKAGEVRFHVVEAGTGEPVILLAGFPQSCYAWRRVMPLLAATHRAIAVDLPGQGDSDKPVGGYDTRTAAHRIHELTRALGLSRYTLVGHDIGAWITYPYAAEFPDELAGAVLLDANIPGITLPPTLTLSYERNWRNWHFLFNTVEDLPEALLTGRERVLIEWFFGKKTANATATFSQADIDEYERAYRTLGGLRGMLGYYRAVFEDTEQNKRYAEAPIRTPVLALGGEFGSAPDIYEALSPLCSDIRGGIVPGSGHYIPEEEPVVLHRRILDFLKASSG